MVIHTLDDDAMSMFAIITFRHDGPMKEWPTVAAANVHNARTKPLAHVMVNAPPPLHLIGTGDLVADVKSSLRGVDIDPSKLRKNGVIAYESILTASAAFFDQGSEQERRERLDCWVAEQVKWALERYGPLRVVSMVLHVDEKVPHIHLVLLPLEAKADARFGDKDLVRWSLVGRTISGPGKFDEVQDTYAAAMAQFGLVRGVKGSGRKHEPVPVYLARMAAKERDVDAVREQLRHDAAALIDDRAAHNAQVAEDDRRLAAERAETARLHQFAAETVRDAQAMSDRINRNRAQLALVFKAAGEFQRRVDALAGKPLTPAVSSTMEALIALGHQGVTVSAPAGETRPAVLSVYAGIQQRATSLGR